VRGLERILELQEMDSAIDRLEAERRDMAEGTAVRESQARVEEVEEQVGELRLALDSIVREQSRLENEADSLEQKIADEEKRLYDGSVANPKELEAIQAEVGHLRQRKGRIEDEALDQMERREGLEGRLPPLEERLAQGRADLDELRASSAEALSRVENELVALRTKRGELVGAFDEELLELYEDLRVQKHGIGAAQLVNGVCGGCHQKLSALELERIKKTEGIRRCEYCRRILVLD
jgi:hypothetical protein